MVKEESLANPSYFGFAGTPLEVKHDAYHRGPSMAFVWKAAANHCFRAKAEAPGLVVLVFRKESLCIKLLLSNGHYV